MSKDFSPSLLSDLAAARIAPYAMLAAQSYHKASGSGRLSFPVDLLGWNQLDMDGVPIELTRNEPTKLHPLSDLAYDIYGKKGTNEIVFAFRGTDSKKDWLTGNLAIPPFNFQYREAKREFNRFKTKNPSKNYFVAGHSLGGGLALSVSVHFGIPAFTFDSSPRVFDGLGDFHEPAERVLVFQKGEILDLVRKIWRKDNEVFDPENIFECAYSFPEGVSEHRGDYLALELLKQGSKVDKSLEGVWQGVKKL